MKGARIVTKGEMNRVTNNGITRMRKALRGVKGPAGVKSIKAPRFKTR